MKLIRRAMPVEAFVFTKDAEMTAPKWFGKLLDTDRVFIDRAIVDGAVKVYGCTIRAPAGSYKAKIGDYIVKDANENISVCKKNELAKEYEKTKMF